LKEFPKSPRAADFKKAKNWIRTDLSRPSFSKDFHSLLISVRGHHQGDWISHEALEKKNDDRDRDHGHDGM
jgi:hypothetical protein